MNTAILLVISNIASQLLIMFSVVSAGVGFENMNLLIALVILPSIIVGFLIGYYNSKEWLLSFLSNLPMVSISIITIITALSDLRYPNQNGVGELKIGLIFLGISIIPVLSAFIGKNLSKEKNEVPNA